MSKGCFLLLCCFWASPDRVAEAYEAQAPPRAPHELVLVGRVSGHSASEGDLQATLGIRGGPNSYERSSSSPIAPDGGFRLRVLPGHPPSPEQTFDYTLLVWTEAEGGARVAARIAWKGLDSRGEHDVGDIHLTFPPLLAAGRVAAPGGGPLPGTLVRVEVGPLRPQTVAPGERWRSRRDLYARSGADGTFAVHGLLGEGEESLRLSVDHPQLARSEGEVVRVGARGVALGGVGGEVIAGRVLADEGLPPGTLRVEVAPLGAPHRRVACQPGPDGSVSIGNLAPDTYSVSVFVRDEPSALATVDRVRSGPEADFGSIDLRGRLRVLTVRLVDRDGEPVRGATVQIEPAGANVSRAAAVRDATEGALEIATSHAALDLWIDSPLHRIVELRGVDGDRLVVLEPPLEVEVLLENRPAWLPPGTAITIGLCPRAHDRRSTISPGGQVDEEGRARLALRVPGFHTPTIALRDASGRTRAFGGARQEWLVLDQPGPQGFSLAIDEETSQRLRRYWDSTRRPQ